MAEPRALDAGRAELSSPSAARAILAAALLLSLVLAFWQMGFPLQGSEGRWAMVSREMASSRNLFSMTIAGRPYDDKPFGSYWLILLASKLTGSMSEFTLRLPSVVSYVLTVLLIYVIGRRTVGSPVTSALATFIYATTFRIVYFSREANADAQTVLGIAVALLLALEAGEKPRWFILPLIGLVMGLSSLMKGLTGVAVPCFAAFLWCLLVRGFRWLRPAPAALGIVAFAATLGAPFLIARAQQGGWHPVEQLWRESVGRAVSPYDHKEAWYFYFWNQFELLSPWSAFLPAAIGLWIVRIRAQAAKRGGFALRMFDQEQERRRFYPLFCYAAIFLFFTLSRSRRTYYLMPAAPFVSVVLAQALLEDLPKWAAWFRRALFWASAIVMTMAGAVALFIVDIRLSGGKRGEPYLERVNAVIDHLHLGSPLTLEMWYAVPGWLILSGVAGIVFGAVLAWRTSLRDRLALVPLICSAALVALTTVGVLDSLRAVDQSLPCFGERVDTLVPRRGRIDLTGTEDRETGAYTGMASVLYYIHREPAIVAKQSARYRIVYARDLPKVLAEGKYVVLCKMFGSLSPDEEKYTKNPTLLERSQKDER
jgi:4-amino-4-deoxy-L-arabinose transferase-like glycosyltransferase